MPRKQKTAKAEPAPATKKIKKEKTPFKKAATSRAQKSKEAPVQTPSKLPEKPEEIEVTIEYLSNKKEGEVPKSGKKSSRPKKEPKTPRTPKTAKKSESGNSPSGKKRTPGFKKGLPVYLGKESIVALLETVKNSNFKDLVHELRERVNFDCEARVKLDLASLENSGQVVYEKGAYFLYKDFELEPVVIKEKNPPSEVKKTPARASAKSSRKKTPARNTSTRKGRKSSNKKSAVKEVIEEEGKQEEEEGKNKEAEAEAEAEEENDVKAEEVENNKGSSKKSEKKGAVITLENEDD